LFAYGLIPDNDAHEIAYRCYLELRSSLPPCQRSCAFSDRNLASVLNLVASILAGVGLFYSKCGGYSPILQMPSVRPRAVDC